MTYETSFQLIKVILNALFSALLAFLLVPPYLKLAAKFRLGDRYADPERVQRAPIASQTLKEKENVPTMGGIIIWLPPIILAFLFYFLGLVFGSFFSYLNYLERRETYLPLFALFLGGFLGLIDDILGRLNRELKFGIKEKIIVYLAVGIFFAWWFIAKLNYRFLEIVDLKIYFGTLPLFFLLLFIYLATTFSFNEVDGLDGLFAGIAILMIIFFLFVSLKEEKYNLASFLGTLLGSLLVYLWFNFYPALFFDGNNGSFSVGSSLAVISFLTGTYLLLPFIGLILVIDSGSVILQLISKKLFKRKIFLSTPIHHHFKALGLKEPQIVVRFWIVNFLGILIAFILYLFLKI